MVNDKVVPCPDCVCDHEDEDHIGEVWDEEEWIECERCGGSGLVRPVK